MIDVDFKINLKKPPWKLGPGELEIPPKIISGNRRNVIVFLAHESANDKIATGNVFMP